MNHIESLRRFFRVSNIAFDFQRSILTAIGQYPPLPTYMETLHRQALIEIEKDNPNMEFIDSLLAQMELTAEQNKAQ
jgi:hypothetical protein